MINHVHENKVFINKYGIVEIVAAGDQDAHTVNTAADRAAELITEQHAAGKCAGILDNLLDLGSATTEARKVLVERLKTMPYDKFAFVSHDKYIRFAANLVLNAIGRGDKVKFFEDYDQANLWLMSK